MVLAEYGLVGPYSALPNFWVRLVFPHAWPLHLRTGLSDNSKFEVISVAFYLTPCVLGNCCICDGAFCFRESVSSVRMITLDWWRAGGLQG